MSLVCHIIFSLFSAMLQLFTLKHRSTFLWNLSGRQCVGVSTQQTSSHSQRYVSCYTFPSFPSEISRYASTIVVAFLVDNQFWNSLCSTDIHLLIAITLDVIVVDLDRQKAVLCFALLWSFLQIYRLDRALLSGNLAFQRAVNFPLCQWAYFLVKVALHLQITKPRSDKPNPHGIL